MQDNLILLANRSKLIYAKLQKIISLIIVTFFLLQDNNIHAQIDSTRLSGLVDQVNEIFLTTYAQGILINPYEILQHNRSRTVNNIEWVDSITYINNSKNLPIYIKNNQTIIHNPGDQYNSKTYFYDKNGKIVKVLKGRHLDDEYIYDQRGYLIQHGHGGELKKAKTKDKTFEWYTQSNNKLQYIATYDDEDKLKTFKNAGSYNVKYDVETYKWENGKLELFTTWIKYLDGVGDTSYTAFQYDSIGLIKTIKNRREDSDNWSEYEIESEIIYALDSVYIELRIKDVKSFSITFDQYDNWIELYNYGRTRKREIVYRKRKRRK